MLALLCSFPAVAQIPEETVTRRLDLARAPTLKQPDKPIAVDSFRGRYRYEIAGFRRLLLVEPHLRRCVDTQRLLSGEFHDRLDFVIEPSGKLRQFSVRRHNDQLQVCLLPHMLPLTFPPFTGRKTPFTLQVLVGSPGARLGRRPQAKPVSVYPVKTKEERRAYSQAVFWVYSPWSMAISRCAEWADQTTSFGYKVQLAVQITPAGQVRQATLQVRGKLADKAADLIGRCVVPFLRGMRVPRHTGPGDFPYRHGTSTAGWGIR